jgi:hypothetical protein
MASETRRPVQDCAHRLITGQQREQRAVGMTAQGAISRLRGKLDETANLFVRENVRRPSRAALTTEHGGRYLMACVFSVQVLGEAYDIAKPSSALMHGRHLLRPLDRRLRVHVVPVICIRIGGETSEVIARLLETESGRLADEQIGLDGASQHGGTSGQS